MGLIHHHGLIRSNPFLFTLVTEKASGESFISNFTPEAGTTLVWNLGDGNVIEAININHTYLISGEKVITVSSNKNVFTRFQLINNKIKGTLDLSKINISGDIRLDGNPTLTKFILNPSSTTLAFSLQFYSCNILGVLDLSTFSNISNFIDGFNNPNLTGLVLPTTPNSITFFRFYNCNLTGTLDLSGLSGIRNIIQLSNNPNLTNVLFSPSSFIISNLQINNCNLTGSLDLSMLSGLRNARLEGNVNLTSVILPLVTDPFNSFTIQNCNLTSLDLSSLERLNGDLTCNNNPNLATLILPDTDLSYQYFYADNCSLDIPFPFGSKIKITKRAQINNNGMSSANVDQTIENIFSSRLSFDNTVTKSLFMDGTNAAPSGIYQAPTGYVQAGSGVTGNDGSPTTAKEKLFVLANQNIDNSTEKKYKWTFTVTGGL